LYFGEIYIVPFCGIIGFKTPTVCQNSMLTTHYPE